MINKLEISGVHAVVTDELKKYVVRKIGRLDRYVARSMRENVRAEVFLKEGNAKDKNKCTCEVIFMLPHDRITVAESTLNMFAAVDIVEAKLRNQLKRYKETHVSPQFHRRLFARFRRRANLVA